MKHMLVCPKVGHLFSLSCLILGGALVMQGCGDTVTDPADVTVFKLKTPMALTATPMQGTVTLSWFANNNEKDFSGFNIYLSTASRDDIVTAFKLEEDGFDSHLYSPVTFKDAKDNKIEGVRASLSKLFNWDEATKTTKAGDGKKFSPYVRCNVSGNDKGGACSKVTDANKKFRANGAVSFTFPEGVLTNGQEYAVFVTSTKDDGEEIGSPTTGVMFVRPRAVTTTTEDVQFSNGGVLAGLDLPAGAAPIKSSGIFSSSSTQFCTATDDTAGVTDVSFESVSGKAYMAGANGARIADLGPAVDKDAPIVIIKESVLNSPLRIDAQVLLPFAEATPAKTLPAANDVGSDGGYTRCGQSLPLKQNHLYSIAIPEGTEWRYAVLSVPNDFVEEIVGTDNKRSGLKFVVGKNQNERRL